MNMTRKSTTTSLLLHLPPWTLTGHRVFVPAAAADDGCCVVVAAGVDAARSCCAQSRQSHMLHRRHASSLHCSHYCSRSHQYCSHSTLAHVSSLSRVGRAARLSSSRPRLPTATCAQHYHRARLQSARPTQQHAPHVPAHRSSPTHLHCLLQHALPPFRFCPRPRPSPHHPHLLSPAHHAPPPSSSPLPLPSPVALREPFPQLLSPLSSYSPTSSPPSSSSRRPLQQPSPFPCFLFLNSASFRAFHFQCNGIQTSMCSRERERERDFSLERVRYTCTHSRR